MMLQIFQTLRASRTKHFHIPTAAKMIGDLAEPLETKSEKLRRHNQPDGVSRSYNKRKTEDTHRITALIKI